jgi:hypothetical protein
MHEYRYGTDGRRKDYIMQLCRTWEKRLKISPLTPYWWFSLKEPCQKCLKIKNSFYTINV